MSPEIAELEALARRLRGRIIEMSHRSKAAHLGSALSCVDILTALYFHVLAVDPADPDRRDRDRCILSKGHAAAALFAVLSARGFFPDALLETFGQPGGCLEEHPGPRCAPGVEAATGSLGHGLSLGLGMSLAGRIQGRSYRVYAVMSDGECNEGSVWEAAMFASGQRLERLMAIVDFNKWQATGRSREVMGLEPLVEKWRAFGWSAYEVDGHDLKALIEVLDILPDGTGRPVAVIAHTVKGKGVSFMEDDNNWHYRIPTAEEVEQARKELGL
ncbi:MAG: transketolase [Thermodesulfobacteriota bacterium]